MDSRATREQVGRHLHEGKVGYGERQRLAEALGVTTRTLLNWERAAAEGERRRPGRPGHSRKRRREVLRSTYRVMRVLGMSAGEARVRERLGSRVPVRLVRHAVKVIKRHHRRVVKRRSERLRRSLAVHHRDALWSMDETHLGRIGGNPVRGQVVRDVATTALCAVSVGGPATSQDAVAVLEAARGERGTLPLVLVTDNGAPYVAAGTEAYLRRNGVVHLRSLPRTPQHNPWAERAVREVKDQTGLGKGARIDCVLEVAKSLHRAVHALNRRPRPSRGGETARALDAALPRWETRVSRWRFHEEVQRAAKDAAQRHETARARRRAVREAIYAVLDKYGLITQTRGGRKLRWVKSEIKS